MREEPGNEEEDYYYEYPRKVQFRLGLTTVHGVAELFNTIFPHALCLTIVPRPWDRFVRWLVTRLPASWHGLVQRWIPGPFLPPRVAIKKLQKNTECHAELFDNEVTMYNRLAPLQGSLLPHFYGEAVCEGRRALVLSVVNDGVLPMDQPLPRISVDEFQRRIQVATDILLTYGVVYGDNQLGNVFLVEDRVVLIDLEYAWAYEPEKLKIQAEMCVADYVYIYNSYLRNIGDDQAQILPFCN